jgi:hypothetical protein
MRNLLLRIRNIGTPFFDSFQHQDVKIIKFFILILQLTEGIFNLFLKVISSIELTTVLCRNNYF